MRTRRLPGSQRRPPRRAAPSAAYGRVAEAMDIHHLDGRVVAEGATQGVQRAAQVVAAVLLVAPHRDLQLAAGEHAFGLGEQFGDQAQGLRGQGEGAAVQAQLLGGGVEAERAVLQQRLGWPCGIAPRQRQQAHLELLQCERLHQVVVAAGLEAEQLVFQRVARGQHQDRRGAPFGAQPACEREAVAVGQVAVEHQGVERAAREQRRGRRDRAGVVALVAARLEVVVEVLGDGAVVFDDEQVHRTAFRSGPPPRLTARRAGSVRGGL